MRSLPQGLGSPSQGSPWLYHLGVPALFSECPLQPSEPLGPVLSRMVLLTGSLCASQPLVGANLLSPGPSPAHTIPGPPCPSLQGVLGSSHQKRQVCRSRGKSQPFKMHLAANSGHKKCTLRGLFQSQTRSPHRF